MQRVESCVCSPDGVVEVVTLAGDTIAVFPTPVSVRQLFDTATEAIGACSLFVGDVEILSNAPKRKFWNKIGRAHV